MPDPPNSTSRGAPGGEDTPRGGEGAIRGSDEISPPGATRGDSESTLFGPTLAASGDSPSRIGRYRILRLIGEGGMGAVYEAEQERPRRIVALKMIKPGLATAQMLQVVLAAADRVGVDCPAKLDEMQRAQRWLGRR